MEAEELYTSPSADIVDRDSVSEEEHARLTKMAAGQKQIINGVLIYLFAVFLSAVLSWIGLFAALISIIVSIIGLVKIASSSKAHIALKILVGVLMVVPLVNFLTLLVVNARTTKALKKGGFKVGFMGAKEPS